MNAANEEHEPSISETDSSGVNLDDVRKLELRYSRTLPGQADLLVENVGGRVRVFEVDRFWIERLVELLEERRMAPPGPIA